ncbi:MucBP domain-containing protein, partial [Clostridium lacusfryxellense]|uniref:MucBP domain-containing protein n=1 Tax=Clostridium lacusfryxellense TaxID=205328 RepID=UPI001C0C9297
MKKILSFIIIFAMLIGLFHPIKTYALTLTNIGDGYQYDEMPDHTQSNFIIFKNNSTNVPNLCFFDKEDTTKKLYVSDTYINSEDESPVVNINMYKLVGTTWTSSGYYASFPFVTSRMGEIYYSTADIYNSDMTTINHPSDLGHLEALSGFDWVQDTIQGTKTTTIPTGTLKYYIGTSNNVPNFGDSSDGYLYNLEPDTSIQCLPNQHIYIVSIDNSNKIIGYLDVPITESMCKINNDIPIPDLKVYRTFNIISKDHLGNPVANAWVYIYNKTLNFKKWAFTNAEGKITFTNVPISDVGFDDFIIRSSKLYYWSSVSFNSFSKDSGVSNSKDFGVNKIINIDPIDLKEPIPRTLLVNVSKFNPKVGIENVFVNVDQKDDLSNSGYPEDLVEYLYSSTHREGYTDSLGQIVFTVDNVGASDNGQYLVSALKEKYKSNIISLMLSGSYLFPEDTILDLGIPVGSATIKYQDENGTDLEAPTVNDDLDLGTYNYDPKEFSGYTTDDTTKLITLIETDKDQVVIFKYTKVVAPPVIIKGSTTIKYQDEDGIDLEAPTVNDDLDLGTYNYDPKEFSGYTTDDTTKLITLI